MIKKDFLEALDTLKKFSTKWNFEKIEQAGDIIIGAILSGNKILTCGNGGSMCDAIHFAEELTGRFREDRKPYAALCISDIGHMTCVANDYNYENVFSRYVEALGKKGDVLVGISTSGNSLNVVNAISVANNMGLKTIGLTGKDGGFMAKFDLCNVEIRAPKTKYSDRIQEIHIKVIHSIINYVEKGIVDRMSDRKS